VVVVTKSEEETAEVGYALGQKLAGGAVVLLFGGLGAGKTAFTRGLVRALGYTGRVTSPTFSIVNEYLSDPPVFHFDLYRLSGADELFDIGWEDYLARGGVCVVEWSEKLNRIHPDGALRVTIEAVSDENRIITIEE